MEFIVYAKLIFKSTSQDLVEIEYLVHSIKKNSAPTFVNNSLLTSLLEHSNSKYNGINQTFTSPPLAPKTC